MLPFYNRIVDLDLTTTGSSSSSFYNTSISNLTDTNSLSPPDADLVYWASLPVKRYYITTPRFGLNRLKVKSTDKSPPHGNQDEYGALSKKKVEREIVIKSNMSISRYRHKHTKRKRIKQSRIYAKIQKAKAAHENGKRNSDTVSKRNILLLCITHDETDR